MAKGEQDVKDAKASANGQGVSDDAQASESPTAKSISGAKPTPCPICDKDAVSTDASYPFCSQRCKNVDLGRWLDGAYIISRPIEQDDLEQED